MIAFTVYMKTALLNSTSFKVLDILEDSDFYQNDVKFTVKTVWLKSKQKLTTDSGSS